MPWYKNTVKVSLRNAVDPQRIVEFPVNRFVINGECSPLPKTAHQNLR